MDSVRPPDTFTVMTLLHKVVDNDMSQAWSKYSLQLFNRPFTQRPRKELDTAKVRELGNGFVLLQANVAFALVVLIRIVRVPKVAYELCIEFGSVRFRPLEASLRHEVEAQCLRRWTMPVLANAFLEPGFVNSHHVAKCPAIGVSNDVHPDLGQVAGIFEKRRRRQGARRDIEMRPFVLSIRNPPDTLFQAAATHFSPVLRVFSSFCSCRLRWKPSSDCSKGFVSVMIRSAEENRNAIVSGGLRFGTYDSSRRSLLLVTGEPST